MLLDFFNRALAHPVLDALMIALTMGGLMLLPVVSGLYAIRGDRRTAKAVLTALLAGAVATLLFYFLAGRTRPPDTLLPASMQLRLILPAPHLPSFPSGHAVLAFAVAGVVALRTRRAGLRWGIFGLAAAIGVSRIYLAHHFPSDVVGGAVLGTTIGVACFGLWQDEPRHRRIRWLLWPQLGVVLLVTQMAYLGVLPWRLLAWPNADKVMHFLLFGAVAFWLNLWLNGRGWTMGLTNRRAQGRSQDESSSMPRRVTVPLAVLLPLTVALVEEGMQSFSALRTASLLDLGADLLGLLFFWWLSRLLLRLDGGHQIGKEDRRFA